MASPEEDANAAAPAADTAPAASQPELEKGESGEANDAAESSQDTPADAGESAAAAAGASSEAPAVGDSAAAYSAGQGAEVGAEELQAEEPAEREALEVDGLLIWRHTDDYPATDSEGRPIVVAEGWLDKVRPGSKTKRPRYYALTPDDFCYFFSKDDAHITEDGYVGADISRFHLSSFRRHGARIPLSSVAKIVHSAGSHVITVVRRDADPLFVHGSSPDNATAWEDMLQEAVTAYRERAPAEEEAAEGEAGEGGAAAAAAPGGEGEGAGGDGDGEQGEEAAKKGGSWGMGRISSLFSSLGDARKSIVARVSSKETEEEKQRRKEELERELRRAEEQQRKLEKRQRRELYESRFIRYRPVAAQGPAAEAGDLQSNKNAAYLEDEKARPLVILHGWVLKKDVGPGLIGSADRERYFVLTPFFVAYFCSDRAANVTEDGYLGGRVSGSHPSRLTGTGGKVQLESIVDIRAHSEVNTRHVEKEGKGKKPSGDGNECGDNDKSDQDDDGEGQDDTAQAAAAAGGGGGGRARAEADSLEEEAREVHEGDQASAAAGAPEKDDYKGEGESGEANEEEEGEKGEEGADDDEEDEDEEEEVPDESHVVVLDMAERIIRLEVFFKEYQEHWVAELRRWNRWWKKKMDRAQMDAWGDVAEYRTMRQAAGLGGIGGPGEARGGKKAGRGREFVLGTRGRRR